VLFACGFFSCMRLFAAPASASCSLRVQYWQSCQPARHARKLCKLSLPRTIRDRSVCCGPNDSSTLLTMSHIGLAGGQSHVGHGAHLRLSSVLPERPGTTSQAEQIYCLVLYKSCPWSHVPCPSLCMMLLRVSQCGFFPPSQWPLTHCPNAALGAE
jgi:hypothetical protein